MNVVLKNAIIYEANASKEDPRRLFIEVSAESGRFKFELNGQTLVELQPVLRTPVHMQGVLEGRLWNGNQRLILAQVEIVPAQGVPKKG